LLFFSFSSIAVKNGLIEGELRRAILAFPIYTCTRRKLLGSNITAPNLFSATLIICIIIIGTISKGHAVQWKTLFPFLAFMLVNETYIIKWHAL
jgi:hypothetical protein